MISLKPQTYFRLRLRRSRWPFARRDLVDLPDYLLRDVGLLDGSHCRRIR